MRMLGWVERSDFARKDAGVTSPDVAILMGTYEGPEFFGRQLESIIAQTVTG